MKFSNVAILSLLHLSIVFGNKLPGAWVELVELVEVVEVKHATVKGRNQSGMQKTADEQQT